MNSLFERIFIVLAIFILFPIGCFADDGPVILINDAIKYGLEHSNTIGEINNERLLARSKNSIVAQLASDLYTGSNDYSKGQEDMISATYHINSAQSEIKNATDLINMGIAPKDIPLMGALSIPRGQNITAFITSQSMKDGMNSLIIASAPSELQGQEIVDILNGAGLAANAALIQLTSSISIHPGQTMDSFLSGLATKIIAQVKQEVANNSLILEQTKVNMNLSQKSFSSGAALFESSRRGAEAIIQSKLNISDVKGFDISYIVTMITRMANTVDKVTTYSSDIFRQQYALLIQKNYYDALKFKKILEVKNSAVDRAKIQYDFSKDSYESGLKSKDEMLQAKMFYTGTRLEYRNAKKDFTSSMTVLKKTIGKAQNSSLDVADTAKISNTEIDLDIDKKNALENRMEIVQAKEEIKLYNFLLEAVYATYQYNSNRIDEVNQLVSKANTKLDKVIEEAESSILQSWENLNATMDMLEESKELISDAKKNLEIAKVKYNEGFGFDNSLLKKLNLEASSGTILEVIAAEENLTQLQQKYYEIENSYNLALSKYLYDTVKLKY